MIALVRSSVIFAMQLLLQVVVMSVPNYCPPRQDVKKICYREECLQMAEDMLERMDTSIHPCQDFYQYACGGWLNKQLLNPQRQRVTTYVNNLPWALIRKFLAEATKPSDHIALQKAKAFYASCINYLKTSDYTRNLEFVVQDYIPNVIWENGTILEKVFINTILLGVHPLFELRADPDSFIKRQRRINLYLGKPVLSMPYDSYEVLSRSKSSRDAFEWKVYTDMKLYDDTLNGSIRAGRIVDVEMRLAMMYNDLTIKGSTVKMTLGQLTTAHLSVMNWTRFVSNLVSSQEIGITDITPHEDVIVSDPEYLNRIFHYFVNLTVGEIRDYVCWRVIDSLKRVLIEDDKKQEYFLGNNFIQTRLLSKYYEYTELDCVKQTSQMFDLVAHRILYTTLNNNTRTQVLNYKRDMVVRFASIVGALDWMSSYTKNKIIDKAGLTDVVFSFHANAMNDLFLESYYSNITADHHFIRSVVSARKAAIVRDIKSIRRTREADSPSFPYQFVTAYSRELNTLHIHPIVLHEPFYNDGYGLLNLAGAGIVLAQEMMSGFDRKGIGYDKNGDNVNLMNDTEIQTFNKRIQCLIAQYDKYTYGPADMHVNGNLTLNSNIADAIGLKMAYKSFRAVHAIPYDLQLLPGVPLTNEQLFFVKFAQMRCTKENKRAAKSSLYLNQSPDEFRVNGPLQNLREFATAFNCPVRSYMNPRTKCEVW